MRRIQDAIAQSLLFAAIEACVQSSSELLAKKVSAQEIETKIATLERQLPGLAAAVRLSQNDIEKENAKKQHEEICLEIATLKIAHEFLAWSQGKINLSILNTAHDFYMPLADFFKSEGCILTGFFESEGRAIKDKNLFSIHCFQEHLKIQLVTETKPVGLISLCGIFFDEPARLVAFLLWLLNRNVTPQEIINSKILHLFFAKQCVFLNEKNNVLEQLYTILNSLKAINKNVLDLLNLVDNTFPDVRGASANRPEKGQFESANLSGGNFTHAAKINPTYKIPPLPPFIFSENPENINTLYKVFGFDFILFLNLNTEPHKNALRTLLLTHEEVLLAQLKMSFQQGDIKLTTQWHYLKPQHFLKSFFQLFSSTFFSQHFVVDKVMEMLLVGA